MIGHVKLYNLLSVSRISKIEAKLDRIAHWTDFLEKNRIKGGTWADNVRRERVGAILPDDLLRESPAIRNEVLYRISYQGYLAREQRQIDKFSHVEKIRLPATIDYLSIRGLRRESALKLAEFKPMTLGQASRISGVNPADISILMVLIESGRGAGVS